MIVTSLNSAALRIRLSDYLIVIADASTNGRAAVQTEGAGRCEHQEADGAAPVQNQ